MWVWTSAGRVVRGRLRQVNRGGFLPSYDCDGTHAVSGHRIRSDSILDHSTAGWVSRWRAPLQRSNLHTNRRGTTSAPERSESRVEPRRTVVHQRSLASDRRTKSDAIRA